MNERIKELANQCRHEVEHFSSEDGFTYTEVFDEEKFAELIVKACADAADMAYDAQCAHHGDYVGEQLGYGEEHGITAWRIGVED